MGARREGYTNLWSTLKGCELEEKGTQTYIKGMGAGKEGYTNLWSTLKGWELEEKGTQTCGVH
jgi:hypothetical protein